MRSMWVDFALTTNASVGVDVDPADDAMRTVAVDVLVPVRVKAPSVAVVIAGGNVAVEEGS